MDIFKTIKQMTRGHREQAAVLTGAMTLVILAAVFVSGGGMGTVARALGLAQHSVGSQIAGIVQVYVSFSASPSTVAPGDQSVLTWSTVNADICYIYAQGSVARGIFPPFLSQNSRSGHPVPGAGNLGTGALSTETQFSVTYIMECHNDGSQNQGYSGVIYSNAVTFQPYTYSPPVFTQWFASQTSIPYNTATALNWSVNPSNRGTTYGVYMYGGPYNATQMSGWTNSATTGNLTASTQFQMIATDSYYGNIYSGPLTVTVGSTPVLSISASGSPGEPSTTGTYTISRTGSTASAQAFGFALSGTATRCTASTIGGCATTTDYYLTSGTCSLGSGAAINSSIPAGSASCTITLTPKDNTTAESTEDATMTLNTSGGGYTLGTSVATLNIADNDSSTDICTDISGTQTTAPSGCNTPSPSPGTCVPSGYTWNGSSCTTSSFNYSVAVPDKTVTRGTSDSVTMSATKLAGTAQAIGYFSYYPALPSGVTTSGFSPSSCTPTIANCTTLPLTVSSSATLGTYPITVYAYDYPAGSMEKTDLFNLTVQDTTGFSFSLSPSTSNVNVDPGLSTQVTIAAYLLSGSGTVSGFYTYGEPVDTSISFSPASCTPSNVSCTTMTISAGAAATPGTYPVYVYSNGGSGSTSFTLTIGGGAAAGLTVSAQTVAHAGEPNSGQGNGIFSLTRSGGADINAALLVPYAITGTAAYGTDYTLGGTCTDISDTGASIPAAEASCTLVVQPIDDSLAEDAETIILTPVSPPGNPV